MHRTIWNPQDQGSLGKWGTVTSSIDWCERNYAVTVWIAEFFNSTTNCAFVILALFGIKKNLENRLGWRFVLGHLGLMIIGIGSALFHMTLLYEWQLADELPMIYLTTLMTWVCFDLTPVNSTSKTRIALPVGLLAFNTIFTYAYLVFPNPIFHQVAYGSLTISTTARAAYLLLSQSPFSADENKRHHDTRKVLWQGVGSFLFGFFIWNLDNLLCVTTTKLKEWVGLPLSLLFELHAYWHILTGIGGYNIMAAMCYLTLCLRDDPANYELVFSVGGLVPTVKRTKRGFKALVKKINAPLDTSSAVHSSSKSKDQ
ncbi:alkaline phytoceramidase [Meredithblackwellia eburnea MCA 4105]